MKAVLDFKMETRPYGDGFTNMVGITCGWCRAEAWHPAKNGGWAVRIFRATGWKVGSKRAQDRCPTCFGKARNARRTPDNPVLTPEVAKAIKATLRAADEARGPVQKEDLLNTSVLVHDPVTVYERVRRPGPEVDPMPPEEARPPPAAAPAPARRLLRRRATPGTTAITRRDNATRSARLALGDHAQDGVEFYTLRLGDGWTWKLAADVKPEELVGWTPIRRLGPRKPTALPTHPPKEKLVTNVTPIKKDPMPTQDTLPTGEITADPHRKLTREERGTIHDELTKVYDIASERYAGSDSDRTLAERLDVPRVGVTEVREMFFGAHDRNQAAVQQVAKLDKAIEQARKASARLMEMAAEAETLERDLRSARKLLED